MATILYRESKWDAAFAQLGADIWHRVPTRFPSKDEPEEWDTAVAPTTRCGLTVAGMRVWSTLPPYPMPQIQCSICREEAEGE